MSADKVAIFLHAGEYDRVHQGLSIAATAAAAGRSVDVFFFWWALERLVEDRLDDPEQETLRDRFEARGTPTLRRLLSHLKESGHCRLYACSGSMDLLGVTAERLSSRVDQIVGWSTILSVTAGVTDRFYI